MRISHLFLFVAGLCTSQVMSATQQSIDDQQSAILACNLQCLNQCQLSMPECLIQCKCDETIRNVAQEVSNDINEISKSKIDWDTFDFNQARDKLFDLKDKYVQYRKEENSLKKYLGKFRKLQILNETVLNTLSDTVLQAGSCDMHCAAGCIRQRQGLHQILTCMNDNCQCTFIANLTDFAEHSIETVTKQLTELDDALQSVDTQQQSTLSLLQQEVYPTTANCNQTCVDQCDFIRQFLDEQNYQFCMEKTCLCTKEQVLIGHGAGVLSLAQQQIDQDYSTVSQSTKRFVVMITIFAFALSILIGVVAVSKPIQKKLRSINKAGQSALSDVKDKLEKSVKSKKDLDIKVV